MRKGQDYSGASLICSAIDCRPRRPLSTAQIQKQLASGGLLFNDESAGRVGLAAGDKTARYRPQIASGRRRAASGVVTTSAAFDVASPPQP